MADKSISELIAANQVTPTDLFVLEQSGTAKKLTGQVLENWLVSFADGHGGIQSIQKVSTSGLVDTYRITMADTTVFDLPVTNGRSITGVSKTATSGLVDTYTITFNDRTTTKFTVANGAKGDKGDNSYVWIKYASQEPTDSSHSIGDIPDNWVGIYSGNSESAPSDWKQYKWFRIKGDKGDTGSPATLVSSSIAYQASSSGVIVPSGTWSSSVPTVAQGKYLWTRVVHTFNTGSPLTSYSVSRMGMDGSGSVSSVCSKSPDSNGNVQLTASDVGAAEKKKYGKLVVFGDSLGQGYNNGDYSFVDVLSESGVFESVSKHCVSGATIGPYQVDSSAAGYSLVEQIERYSSDVADAEIVICEYGGNDLNSFLAGNVEMGTVEDASTATTICGYVKKAITRIYELNPDVAIHWLYPLPREFATLKAMHPNGMDYVDGAILFDACALRMAQNCGCFILIPFCLNRNLLSSDSVHPNTEGHKVYATSILNGLFKEQHLLYTERLLTVSGDTDTLSNLTFDGTFASVLKLIKANVPVRLVSQYVGNTIFMNPALFNQYLIGFTMLCSQTGSDATMAYITWKSDGSVEAHNISLVANAPNAEEVYV